MQNYTLVYKGYTMVIQVHESGTASISATHNVTFAKYHNNNISRQVCATWQIFVSALNGETPCTCAVTDDVIEIRITFPKIKPEEIVYLPRVAQDELQVLQMQFDALQKKYDELLKYKLLYLEENPSYKGRWGELLLQDKLNKVSNKK